MSTTWFVVICIVNAVVGMVVVAWGLFLAVALSRCACALEEILQVLGKKPDTDGTDSTDSGGGA